MLLANGTLLRLDNQYIYQYNIFISCLFVIILVFDNYIYFDLRGPRCIYQRYLDSMAIVCVLGKPILFIAFICNLKWP